MKKEIKILALIAIGVAVGRVSRPRFRRVSNQTKNLYIDSDPSAKIINSLEK